MYKGLVIALVAILGVSIVQVGHMTGSPNDGGHDWFSWWKNLDLKNFISFMSSGGKDDDDDDDNGGHVNQVPIESAQVAFHVGIKEIKADGKPAFQNIVDQCIFHSKESFSPLCVRCEVLDANGEILAKGEVKDPKKSYKASDSIPILVYPVPALKYPNDPAPNDVQKVEGVNVVICGFKEKCPDGKCKCDERKRDHGEEYYKFYKRYEDNKKKFSKSDYSTFMKDYEDYMSENGRYMDSSDFKTFTDYHGQFLKNNKNYFSSADYTSFSAKQTSYSRDTENHHEKCDCHGEEDDHETHYNNFDKYFKANKNKFGKAEYSTFMDNYENYMNKEGKYMDSSECKKFDDYHGQFLKNNKNYFSGSDYQHHSEEHEKHSKDCQKNDEEENECKEKSGFFTGGGKVYVPKYGNKPSFPLTHGFELHCDKTQGPNNLEINWNGNKFHLEQLVEAKCYDDGSINEPPPSPHPGPTLDVYNGNGYGRYNGQCGAFAEWVMDDNGEPGKADQIVALRITGADHLTKLEINPGELGVTDTSRSGTWKNPGTNDNPLWLDLQSGNHQFVPHPSSHPNPPTQTTPCPRVLTP